MVERSGVKIPNGDGGIRAASQETTDEWSLGLDRWRGGMDGCILSILKSVDGQSVNASLVCNSVAIK